MKYRNRCWTAAALLALSLLNMPAQTVLDPSKPPGGNFNLTNWYLGLPVDSSGGTTGSSASISAAQLVGGYSNALYFYTGPDGAMTFWAPVTGATTSGSSYPRSELREQISPPDNNLNWRGYGTHVLSAQCRVQELPSSGKVIIGQIHSKTGEARPLVKLQFNNGVVEALVKNSPTADPDTKFSFQNVGLNNLVTYQIKMVDGLVTMSVNGSNQMMNAFLSDPEWANQEFYFKAGSYCQDNVGTSAEGARVAFYSLSVSHVFTNTPPAGGSRSYQEVIESQNPEYYFKLDNSLVDSAGNTLPLSMTGDGSFTTDALGNPNSAYAFLQSGDALYSTNDLIAGGGPAVNDQATGSGTISLLFRMLSDTNNSGQRYLFSAPASSPNGNQLGLFLESSNPGSSGNANSLKLRVGNTTKGNIGATDPVPVAYPQDLAPNEWHFFAMTYNESRNASEVLVYFGPAGGTLVSGSFNPANNSVVGDNGTLWIGNRDTLTSAFRNPGNGAIDEFAIWHRELSPEEIQAQFATITNAPVAPPILSIALSGSSVVVSWLTNGSDGFRLESTSSLNSPNWTETRSPSVVGNAYAVTNSPGGNAGYYRLIIQKTSP